MVGKLFVVSACSGAGKTTLVTKVINRLSGEYAISRVITYTSKQPRAGEVDGRDYYFLSIQEFEERISNNFFLEWSKEYGAYYGSPLSLIEELRLGKYFILITDVKGALSLAEKIKNSVIIWIDVPNEEAIKLRLFQRKTENNDQIQERILISLKENEKFLKKLTSHYRILNDAIENAVQELELIIKKEIEKVS